MKRFLYALTVFALFVNYLFACAIRYGLSQQDSQNTRGVCARRNHRPLGSHRCRRVEINMEHSSGG